MVLQEAKENEIKAIVHVTRDITLLFISFTIFTFIATINPDILKNDLLLTLQLIISIPLFMSTVLSRSRMGISLHARILDNFGNVTFLLAYGCLINVVGILVRDIVSLTASEIFFGANIAMVLAYSTVKSIHDKKTRSSQIIQDLIFIIFTLAFGLIPVLIGN